MADHIPCPCCLHEETMRARRAGIDPSWAVHDDFALMRFSKPQHKGVVGQVCTQWDQGWWECQVCDLRLPPEKAGILLDAALMCSAPNCDSIVDGMHIDTRRAFRGGRHAQPTTTTTPDVQP